MSCSKPKHLEIAQSVIQVLERIMYTITRQLSRFMGLNYEADVKLRPSLGPKGKVRLLLCLF